ncbi:hypothetical protein FMUND_5315 [Fusarium mundagurra]|uniref:Uncharacterized protein n=1 Tax=Fusarium mundagurra TaxID=1567541 RepID=A0A8H5YSY3_9HYPO|nr:hypothetical protein FMUND_5315 [Fusarium mundagurra]
MLAMRVGHSSAHTSLLDFASHYHGYAGCVPVPIVTEVNLFNELLDIYNDAALFTCPCKSCKLTRGSFGYFAASSDSGDTMSIFGSTHCLDPACGSQLPISTPQARSDCALAILDAVLQYANGPGIRQGDIFETAYEAYLRRGDADADWLIKNFHLARILG